MRWARSAEARDGRIERIEYDWEKIHFISIFNYRTMLCTSVPIKFSRPPADIFDARTAEPLPPLSSFMLTFPSPSIPLNNSISQIIIGIAKQMLLSLHLFGFKFVYIQWGRGAYVSITHIHFAGNMSFLKEKYLLNHARLYSRSNHKHHEHDNRYGHLLPCNVQCTHRVCPQPSHTLIFLAVTWLALLFDSSQKFTFCALLHVKVEIPY